ncbi:hypothetical protein EQG49_12895 [Periweissella cryptocerci]|uniref:Uncharacterized protein n=1 Tax=Periweissella cryptocerci TaxID=2506420 RepID=A0A4P6YWS9_9LACO|nr:hypothetical protein [Periweissella cryptocerci]QBO37294.1 hypothetical protein EQG49_12895 [Periweissella cryptocerci]
MNLYGKIENDELKVMMATECPEGYYPVIFNAVPPYDQETQLCKVGLGTIAFGTLYVGYEIEDVPENNDESAGD